MPSQWPKQSSYIDSEESISLLTCTKPLKYISETIVIFKLEMFSFISFLMETNFLKKLIEI